MCSGISRTIWDARFRRLDIWLSITPVHPYHLRAIHIFLDAQSKDPKSSPNIWNAIRILLRDTDTPLPRQLPEFGDEEE
tara:strand:+ start:101 stop:337 length:237 start_codon:yes stop_codon:yes gene_type:complete